VFYRNVVIAVRHLWDQRGYTALNIVGLAAGMTTCLLISLYMQDELSYDDFHPHADRIQLMMIGDSTDQDPVTPYPLRRVLADEVSSVTRVTQTATRLQEFPVRFESDGREIERVQRILRADSSFFRVFTGFPLLRGRRTSVLDAPREVVIRKRLAEDFFGDNDPIGRTLIVGEDSTRRYTVVGVTTVPTNSTIQFDMVASWTSIAPSVRASWRDRAARTYAQVEEDVSSQQLTQTAAQAAPLEKTDRFSALDAMPLTDYYLSEENRTDGFQGEMRYLYIFGTVALLVLLIAMVNYVNLVTVQGRQRAREVGVRKVVGADRGQVMRQFLTETLLLCGLALILATVLAVSAVPTFNALFGKNLSLTSARHGWELVISIGVVLTVTIAGGAYPAFVLSGLHPTRILRGESSTTVGSRSWLQKGMVVVQFAISAGLIFGTAVIYQQLDYVQTKDLGFDGKQVVTVDLDELDEKKRRLVKRKAKQNPHVHNASVGSLAPGGTAQMVVPKSPTALSPQAQGASQDNLLLRLVQVDTNYVETLGLNVLAGQSFASSAPAVQERRYILNQAAVKALGWNKDEAVGKSFRLHRNDEGPLGKVIGVVENFHLASLRSPIAPVVLALQIDYPSSESILAVRLSPDGISAGMDHLRETVSTVAPQAEFTYTFLDEKFDAMYQSERRLARIFAVFAAIAILIACMGLFGLAAFAAQRRTREIGIRKALGASVTDIIGLVSKEYIALVAASLTLGLPAAYLWVQRWLDDFAYQVDVGVEIFLFASGLVLCVAGSTVSYLALRAACTNPATTLRDE